MGHKTAGFNPGRDRGIELDAAYAKSDATCFRTSTSVTVPRSIFTREQIAQARPWALARRAHPGPVLAKIVARAAALTDEAVDSARIGLVAR